MAHIHAAEQGGPRFNPDQSDDDRRGIENLLLLCPNHHRNHVDKDWPNEFDAVTLREYKAVSEQTQSRTELDEDAVATVLRNYRSYYHQVVGSQAADNIVNAKTAIVHSGLSPVDVQRRVGGGAGGSAGVGGAIATCAPECPEGSYCAGQGCDGPGQCEARPEVCTGEIVPVCGCDGNTYDNACLAALGGVRVDSEGSCPCFTNENCEPNEYCVRSPACESGPGTCQLKPTECMDQFVPVCGCDGNTYDTACFANAAGVLVSADRPCDCDVNVDCDPADFCNGSTCDGPGFCDPRPLDCPDDRDVVPTCDGVGYFNACFAAQAGARVRPTE